jgi:hypothetical protein
LAQKVDGRIWFLENLDILIRKFRADADYASKRARVLENLKERVKEHTKLLVEANPELTFQGSSKCFKVQANGGKQAITYSIPLCEVSNVLTDEDAKYLEPEYKEQKVVWVLKKDTFDHAIRNGAMHPFATLESRGTHLRIR